MATRRRLHRTLSLAALSAPLLAAPGHAVDGVLEINQTCALNGGCFAGDAAGFPVTITSPGSYRLTSSLDVRGQPTPQDVTVIDVNASQVTLDLNGFEIVGSTSCSGSPTTCSPTGTGTGIDAFPSRDHIAVFDGTVRGMGDDGVRVSNYAAVRGLFLSSNGGDGIQASSFSVLTGNVARHNGGTGISSGSACVLKDNTAGYNGGDGISTSYGSTVADNSVTSSGGDGIQTGGDSTVIGNASRLNGGFGLRLGISGYTDNVVNSNGTGTVSGGIEIGTNLCDVDTICP